MPLLRPEVSVLMAAYNAERYIRESIESVLKQDHPSFELVIVDDGSTDRTWNIIRALKRDPRLRAYRRRKNRGEAWVRNLLVKLSRGRYVANHDADDLMVPPDRLRKQAGYLSGDGRVGVVYGDTLLLDESQKPCFGRPSAQALGDPKAFLVGAHHCASMIRRKAILKTGGYDTSFRMGPDVDMWLRLSEVTRFKRLKGPSLIYRRNEQGLSATRSHLIEKSYETAFRNAVRRRAAGRMRKMCVPVGDARLRILTNSGKIAETLRRYLYLDGGDTRHSFDCHYELYECPSIGGIYRHIRFTEGGSGPVRFAFSDDGQALYIRSDAYGLTGKISRADQTVSLYITSSSRLKPEDLMEWLVMHPLVYLTRPLGWRFVHSSAVADGKNALLIFGATFSGKTTLALNLVRRGLRLLSDETNIIRISGSSLRVCSFPRKTQIKRHSFRDFPEIADRRRFLTRTESNKWLFSLDDIYSDARQKTPVFLKRAVLLKYKPRAWFKAEKIPVDRAVRLFRNDPDCFLSGGEDKIASSDAVLLIRALVSRARLSYCEYSAAAVSSLADHLSRFLKRTEP